MRPETRAILAARGQQLGVESRRRAAAIELETVTLLARIISQCHAPTNAAGVYLLFDENDHVVYVGQAERVLVRMGGHHDKAFAHAKMIEVAQRARRLEIERRLIEILRPRLNTSGMPPVAA